MCVCLCVSRYKSCFYNSSTGACKIAGVYVMLYVYNVPSFLFLQLSNSLYLYKNSIWLYKIGSKIYKISYKACSKGSSDYSMHFLLTRLNWDLKTKKAINATSSHNLPDSIQHDYKGCICICMIDRLIGDAGLHLCRILGNLVNASEQHAQGVNNNITLYV